MSANCNNLSAVTQQSEFDNHYLLISFTLKTPMDFSACPRGILCNLHLKVQKKGKPTFHYPETAAPNVSTTQVRPQLQRLITGQWSSSCHFPLAPERLYSLSDLRIVFSLSIWTAFSPTSKYILTSPSVHFNPHPTENSEINGVEISFWDEKWELLLKGPHTIFWAIAAKQQCQEILGRIWKPLHKLLSVSAKKPLEIHTYKISMFQYNIFQYNDYIKIHFPIVVRMGNSSCTCTFGKAI